MAKIILQTKLCDLLEIEYPIMLAGMNFIAGPKLVAAVSNAGGLGVLGATGLPSARLRDWIRETKSLTDKPFGVDLLLPVMPQSGRTEAVRLELPSDLITFVNQLKEKLGIPDVKVSRQGNLSLTVDEVTKAVEVILEEGVAVFAAGLGTPEWVIPEMHARGIKVVSLVGNVKNARRVAERGTDIVVAQGHEAGGHTGRIGTLALVPQVVDAVQPIPVVAAGGIGDGRGLVASLALGAVGVWVGSAFIPTVEACVDYVDLGYFNQATADDWKQRMLESSEEDTVVSRTYTGKTARTLKNRLTETWAESGMPYLPMPLQGLLIADLQAGARQAGMTDLYHHFAGQITGMLKEIKTAQQVMEEMTAQASQILQDGLTAEVTSG